TRPQSAGRRTARPTVAPAGRSCRANSARFAAWHGRLAEKTVAASRGVIEARSASEWNHKPEAPARDPLTPSLALRAWITTAGLAAQGRYGDGGAGRLLRVSGAGAEPGGGSMAGGWVGGRLWPLRARHLPPA